MWDQEEDDMSEAVGTVFRDVIFLLAVSMVSVVMLILPFINIAKKKEREDIPAPGNVIVELYWNDASCADVDLWMQAPGDKPVGYSAKNGEIADLLRDDLGCRYDITGRNYETIFTRGVVPGKYTINVLLFRSDSKYEEEKVRVVISLKDDPNSSARQILFADLVVNELGAEKNVFVFEINEDGNLIPDSVTREETPLAYKR